MKRFLSHYTKRNFVQSARKIKSGDNLATSEESVRQLNFSRNRRSPQTSLHHRRWGKKSLSSSVLPPPLPSSHLKVMSKAIFSYFPTATDTSKLYRLIFFFYFSIMRNDFNSGKPKLQIPMEVRLMQFEFGRKITSEVTFLLEELKYLQ